jgi:hypothetical protein
VVEKSRTRESENNTSVRFDESMDIEYCLVIDELFRSGLGLDVAVLKAMQSCAALVQRVSALQARDKEREREWELEREADRERERVRATERNTEMGVAEERERKWEQERASHRLEMKERLRVRESERASQLQIDTDKDNASWQSAAKKSTGEDDPEFKQLKLLLEQKERLLSSQTATASALETAVEALKGQVHSGKIPSTSYTHL